jgi:hypothetical protein
MKRAIVRPSEKKTTFITPLARERIVRQGESGQTPECPVTSGAISGGDERVERTVVGKLLVQRGVAVRIVCCRSPSATHTLGFDCDWRLTKL